MNVRSTFSAYRAHKEWQAEMAKEGLDYQAELNHLLVKAGVDVPVELDTSDHGLRAAGVCYNDPFQSYFMVANYRYMANLTHAERLAVLAHEVIHIKYGDPRRSEYLSKAHLYVEIVTLFTILLVGAIYTLWLIPLGLVGLVVLNTLIISATNAYRRRVEYRTDREALALLGPSGAAALVSAIHKCKLHQLRVYGEWGVEIQIPLRWVQWILAAHPSDSDRCTALGLTPADVLNYRRAERQAAKQAKAAAAA